MRAGTRRYGDPRAGQQLAERAGKAIAAKGPSLGIKILKGFTASGDGTWTAQIYDRENGKTYRCRMR